MTNCTVPPGPVAPPTGIPNSLRMKATNSGALYRYWPDREFKYAQTCTNTETAGDSGGMREEEESYNVQRAPKVAHSCQAQTSGSVRTMYRLCLGSGLPKWGCAQCSPAVQ